jgi:hypothetical protein
MDKKKPAIKTAPMGSDPGFATKGASQVKEGKEINYVHKQTIHAENIRNEKKSETKNFKYEYTFSPFSCKLILI